MRFSSTSLVYDVNGTIRWIAKNIIVSDHASSHPRGFQWGLNRYLSLMSSRDAKRRGKTSSWDRGSTPNWKPRGCEEAWPDTIVTQDEHCKLRPAVSVFGLKGRRVDLDLVTDWLTWKRYRQLGLTTISCEATEKEYNGSDDERSFVIIVLDVSKV